MLNVALGISAAQADPLLYVAGPPDFDPVYGGQRILTIVDAATDQIVGTASYSTGQPVAARSVSVSPSGRYVYVTNDGGVDEVDTATAVENRSLGFPYGGGTAVVAGPPTSGSRPAYAGGNEIGFFDFAQSTISSLAPPGPSTATGGLVLDRTGRWLYATDFLANVVNVVDVQGRAVVASIPVGFAPVGIALNSMGTRAYVASVGAGQVDVIDTATRTVVDTIPMGPNNNLQYLTVHPLGTFVYVSNTCPDNGCAGAHVAVVDAATDTVTATIAVGPRPTTLAITPDGSKLYVTTGCTNGDFFGCGTGHIAVVDTSTNQMTNSIAISDVSGLGLIPPSCAELPDGTPCNDETDNTCVTEVCHDGGCGLPVADGTPCNDGVDNTCVSDVCHGGVCGLPLADETPCDDHDVCTQTDACQGGVCVGTDPITCPEPDECHVAGTCDSGTGICSDPPVTDGTPCVSGPSCSRTDVCVAGSCICPGSTTGPEMSGNWQIATTIAGYVQTQFVFLLQDAQTGSVAMTQGFRCGTTAFAGSIYRQSACTQDPTVADGTVQGALLDIPSFQIDTTYPTPFSAPGCPAVGRELSYNHLVGTIVEDANGTPQEVDGTLLFDAYLYDENGADCGHFNGLGGSFTMRRTDVSVGSQVSSTPLAGGSIRFDTVASAGNAAMMTIVDATATLPTAFRLTDNTYVDVLTTADHSGTITTCLPYRDADHDGFVDDTNPPMAEGDLQILHDENGTFVDRTVSRDPVNDVICAETSSLSDFALGTGPTATTTTTTTTTVTTTTMPAAPTCGPSPAVGCQSALSTKASLALSAGTTADRNKLVWKWTSGGTVNVPDFGDPAGTTGYHLCVYDSAGLAASVVADGGGQCGTKPCWKLRTTGAKYTNKAVPPAGAISMSLKGGGGGHAKIGVKAKGGGLDLLTLPQTTPVTVQFQRTDTGACWGATYSGAPRVVTSTKFIAKSD
jgi:YVTN family beta-propeller protein